MNSVNSVTGIFLSNISDLITYARDGWDAIIPMPEELSRKGCIRLGYKETFMSDWAGDHFSTAEAVEPLLADANTRFPNLHFFLSEHDFDLSVYMMNWTGEAQQAKPLSDKGMKIDVSEMSTTVPHMQGYFEAESIGSLAHQIVREYCDRSLWWVVYHPDGHKGKILSPDTIYWDEVGSYYLTADQAIRLRRKVCELLIDECVRIRWDDSANKMEKFMGMNDGLPFPTCRITKIEEDSLPGSEVVRGKDRYLVELFSPYMAECGWMCTTEPEDDQDYYDCGDSE